jgi:adsorption protein B
MRAGFTAAAYGWREGLRAIPRMAIGNGVLMLAAAAALARYRALRRGGRPRWDKTAHIFPAARAAE